MPTQQEIEDYIRAHAGVPIQNAVGQAADTAQTQLNQMGNSAMALKQAALQQLSLDGSNSARSLNPQQAQPIPEVLPNDPSMSKNDTQSRMAAMIQAPATMAQVEAKLKAQADEDEAAEQRANAMTTDPMNGYTRVLSRVQQEAAAHQPRQFNQIKQKIQGSPENIRDTFKGPVEVTPDLEKKLGYGKDEDEE